MNTRIHNLIIAAITVLAGCVFVFTLARSVVYFPESEIAPPISSAATLQDIPSMQGRTGTTAAEEDLPARLVIPTINVDADVQHVGIAKSGNMAVPTNFYDVGWYKYGTVPGDMGSAVVAGHVDNALSLPGVFKNLHKLKKGDLVHVIANDGKRHTFKVTDLDYYDYDNAPSELIFNQQGAKRLKLITCVGNWIQSEKTYDKRLVVTAEMVGIY